MIKRGRKLLAKDLDALLADMRRLRPGARHLNDSEAFDYVGGSLSLKARARVEKHLKDCATCARSIAQARTLVGAWDGPAGEARLEQFCDRLRAELTPGPQGREAQLTIPYADADSK